MPEAKNSDPHGRVSLHLSIRSSQQKRNLLMDFLAEAIPFYESTGDLKVRVLQDTSDSDAFIEVIEYDSQEGFERDNKRTESDPEMQQYLSRWRSLIDQLDVKVYRDITSHVRK